MISFYLKWMQRYVGISVMPSSWSEGISISNFQIVDSSLSWLVWPCICWKQFGFNSLLKFWMSFATKIFNILVFNNSSHEICELVWISWTRQNFADLFVLLIVFDSNVKVTVHKVWPGLSNGLSRKTRQIVDWHLQISICF